MESVHINENKPNLELNSVLSSGISVVDSLINQESDISVMEEDLKTEPCRLIDLTLDESTITTISPPKSVIKLTRQDLKQTQLNSFFCSIKNSSTFKNEKDIASLTKSNELDALECLNKNLTHSENKINNQLDTYSNLQYNVKEELLNQDVIDLCMDSTSENEGSQKVNTKSDKKTKFKNSNVRNKRKMSLKTGTSLSSPKSEKQRLCGKFSIKSDKEQIINGSSLTSMKVCLNDSKDLKKEYTPRNKRPNTVESEKNQCPPYKVIEGTTFAVDAFNFGLIKDVTAYFLTHFHTDHYIGLTKKFSMPIYASEITIKLIHGFISVDEKLMNILPLNTPLEIEGVYVTAIDANHCPGAIMLLFELPNGKRILHTGDFRWSHKMELDLLLHVNEKHIDLLYLDTTHISDRHNINSQAECISKAIHWVREFKKRNEDKKILYVVCTDVIGKENFWLSIAEAFNLKIWSDGKRRKALSLIGNKQILRKLVSNANEADMHVVSHSDAGFRHLEKYFEKFSESYDIILSIKPKGSDSIDPEFEGKVSSVSIRYSEHSTHKELRKFLRFLLPNRVISTVPIGKNIFRCPKIPVSWHTKELYVPYSKQASLLNYVSVNRNK